MYPRLNGVSAVEPSPSVAQAHRLRRMIFRRQLSEHVLFVRGREGGGLVLKSGAVKVVWGKDGGLD